MVNATAFADPIAWSNITNGSTMNLVSVGVEAWKQSAEGFGAILVFSAIVFLLGGMIYMRTQKVYPTVLIMMLSTYILDYYSVFDIVMYDWHMSNIIYIFYIIEVVLLAITIVYDYKRGG